MHMDKESTFLPDLTLGYGLFLVVWGIVVSLASSSESVTWLSSHAGAVAGVTPPAWCAAMCAAADSA